MIAEAAGVGGALSGAQTLRLIVTRFSRLTFPVVRFCDSTVLHTPLREVGTARMRHSLRCREKKAHPPLFAREMARAPRLVRFERRAKLHLPIGGRINKSRPIINHWKIGLPSADSRAP